MRASDNINYREHDSVLGHIVTQASPENTNWTMLWAGLQVLMGTQGDLHKMSPQKDDSRKKQLQDNFLALHVELSELLQEMDWKPWLPENDNMVDESQIQVISEEFADVLAFLGHIIRILNEFYGITVPEIASAYAFKSEKNERRFLGL